MKIRQIIDIVLISVAGSLIVNPAFLKQAGYQFRESFYGSRSSVVEATVKQPPAVAENSIAIPKIDVSAPLVFPTSKKDGFDLNEGLLEDLRQGIVHYPETSLPGQSGNVFFFGHSSTYWWDNNQYGTVFSLLNRLTNGDLVYINYQNTLYTYEVKASKTVSPSDMSVLTPTAEPTLSLMTCTPIGTDWQRLVVTANLIDAKSLQ